MSLQDKVSKLSALGGDRVFKYLSREPTFQVYLSLGKDGLIEKTPFMNFCSRTEDASSEVSVPVEIKVITADLAVLIVL